jgi:LAGLIDADG endonuclease
MFATPFIKPSSSNRLFDFNYFYTFYSEIYPNNLRPSKEFLEWFIGFSEGDGSFIVAKRGDLQIIISQSTFNVKVLYYIKNNLGFGKVIQQSKSNKTHRYIVQDMKNLSLISLIFNGNMVFFTRNARFLIFLSAFNDKALRMKLNTIVPIIDTILPNLNDS